VCWSCSWVHSSAALGRKALTFVHGYPDQAALARLDPASRHGAALRAVRDGIELAMAFTNWRAERTARTLRARQRAAAAARPAGFPADERLLARSPAAFRTAPVWRLASTAR